MLQAQIFQGDQVLCFESMDDFGVVNEIYGIFFTENPPARKP